MPLLRGNEESGRKPLFSSKYEQRTVSVTVKFDGRTANIQHEFNHLARFIFTEKHIKKACVGTDLYHVGCLFRASFTIRLFPGKKGQLAMVGSW